MSKVESGRLHLQHLHIERLRLIESLTLDDLQQVNVFCGANGSGKTSILEAIYLLATGRSFRTHLLKPMIAHQQKDLLVFAQGQHFRFGMQRPLHADPILKLNGEVITQQSEFARLLPVQVIDPEGLAVLDSGSKPRRQLLDWLMFHVEPQFHPQWLRYQRALKQRNALLKMPRLDPIQLTAWEAELAAHGEQLHQMRSQVFAEWMPHLHELCAQLLPDIAISCQYHAGFDTSQPLIESLAASRERDRERGHTSLGAHRADLSFKTALGVAEDSLSRGQKKLLIVSLRLSQLRLLRQQQRTTVVLLDDLTAELDRAAQQRLLSLLLALDSQIFLTTLALEPILTPLQQLAVQPKVVMLEQGRVHIV